jgi:hypothetical protein
MNLIYAYIFTSKQKYFWIKKLSLMTINFRNFDILFFVQSLLIKFNLESFYLKMLKDLRIIFSLYKMKFVVKNFHK